MKTIVFTISLLAALPLAATANGREPSKSADSQSEQTTGKPIGAGKIALGVLIAEGLFLINSGLAAANPQIYGGAAMILAPFTPMADESMKTTHYAGVGGLAGIGLYNLAVLSDEEQYDKQDILIHNLVAWHIVVAAIAGTAWLSGEYRKLPELAVVPHKNGLQVSYRRSF